MVKLRSMSVSLAAYGNVNATSEVKGFPTVKKTGPVAYDSSNWFQILFQCFGSSWPKVLPFCILNTLSMVIFTLLRDHHIIDCSISGQAHTYGSVILSFLLVSRVNTAGQRYAESRGFIGVMYQETRELIQYGLCLSNSYDNNDNEESREWRNELAYRAMILLRTSIAVVEFCSRGLPAWKVPELTGLEQLYLTPNVSWDRHSQRLNNNNDDNGQIDHDNYANSMRVPFRAAYLLRETIVSCEKRLTTPLHITQINAMLGSVDRFLTGFYGCVLLYYTNVFVACLLACSQLLTRFRAIHMSNLCLLLLFPCVYSNIRMRKFITTPVPFPLIQMTRTILCFYLFTIPLVFLSDTMADNMLERCLSVFMLTYGFMGLELVAIELDDPFGTDDNDFE